MMSTYSVTLLFVLASSGFLQQSTQEPAGQRPETTIGGEPTDVAAIHQVFSDFMNAALNADGEAAVRMVDRGTFNYYNRIKALALEGEADTVKGEIFMSRWLIVTLRHVWDPHTVREMELQYLLTHLLERQWIRSSLLRELKIRSIEVHGDRATVKLALGSSAGDAAVTLNSTFVLEHGEWRFQPISLLESLSPLVQQMSAQMGMSENDLILQLVEQATGKKVAPDVWQNPASRP